MPEAIFRVVQKCLSEEPELRWKNVKELKKALRRAEKKVPVKKGGAAAGEGKEKPSLLIEREEGKFLEFKASIRNIYPNQEPQVDDKGQQYWLWGEERIKSKKSIQAKLGQQILKTVAAFFNSHGGDLIVGIHEKDNKKEYVSISHDDFSSHDKYLQYVKSLLKNGLDDMTIITDYVDTEIFEEGGHDLCRIKVEKKPDQASPVFLKDDDRVFVRNGNTTEGYNAKQYEKLKQRRDSK